MKKIIYTAYLIIILSILFEARAQWVQTNGPEAADINSFAAFPDSSGGVRLFAGNESSGIYLSTNNGNNWIDVSEGLGYTLVEDIAGSPDGKNIIAGCWSDGVFLSTDYGLSWTAVNNGLPSLQVISVAVYQSESGIHFFAGSVGSGVYYSDNMGASWTFAGTGLPSGIEVFQVLPGINYKYLFAGTSEGIFVTTDHGLSWSPSGNGIPAPYYTVDALAVSPDSTRLFASLRGNGIYYSDDKGENWSAVGTQPNIYITSLAAPAYDTGTKLIAATGFNGIFMSTDNGVSWDTINQGLHNTWIKTLSSYNYNNETYLLAGSEKGVYSFMNDSTKWVLKNSGLRNDVNLLGVLDNWIFSSSWGAGLYQSSDHGDTWIETGTGFTQIYIHAIIAAANGNNKIIFTGGAHSSGILRSTDHGFTWSAANTGLTSLLINDMAVMDTNIIASTFQGVYLSSDYGDSWNFISAGLTYEVAALAVSGNSIFAGSLAGVYVTTDAGITWNSSGLTDIFVLSLRVLSTGNGDNILAGTWNSGVFRSTDKGVSWISTSLPHRVYNFTEADSFIFAAAYGSGVFLSTDKGETWDEINEGLTFQYVHDLDISGDYLFAGTEAGGVWRRKLNEIISSTAAEPGKPEFILDQNYPNPFNPETVVEFTLPEAGKIKLSIYDILGKEITTLADGFYSSGSHRFIWNAKGYAAGVYFCRLTAAGSGIVRKMILAK